MTVVAPTQDELMTQLVDAFNKKYPGIKVNVTNMTAGQTVERIVTESSAGKTSVDTSQASLDTIQPLIQRQLLGSADWSSLTDGAPQDLVLPGGLGVTYYHLPNLIAYNSSLLKDGDAPKQWEDLAKPQFKGGKLLLDNRGHFMDHLGFQWGEDKMVQYARDLKAQQPLFVPRMSDAVQRLAAGEAPVATVSLGDYQLTQAKGAPIKIAGVGPINASNFVLYVLKSAPHPNAARLYVAWSVSKEARALFEKIGSYALATPGSGTKVAQTLSDLHIDVWTPKTTDDVDTEAKYQKAVQDVFGK